MSHHLLPLLALLLSTISAHPNPRNQPQSQDPKGVNPWEAVHSDAPQWYFSATAPDSSPTAPSQASASPIVSAAAINTPIPIPASTAQNQSTPWSPSTIDPCGPPAQYQRPHPTNSIINSCKAPTPPSRDNPLTPLSALSTNASVFGISCLNDGTGMRINAPSCASNALEMCYRLSYLPASSPRGQWLWSASEHISCTFGVFLPPNKTSSAKVPGYARCVSDVLGGMARGCVGAQWAGNGNGNPAEGAVVGVDGGGVKVPNVGAVNLRKLPSVNQTGEAVDERYPSYIVVAQTYDQSVVEDALEQLRREGEEGGGDESESGSGNGSGDEDGDGLRDWEESVEG